MFLDQNGNCLVLLADIAKTFDCLRHDLLIAELHDSGCELPSLKLLLSYLRTRQHYVKINNSYSSWAETLFRVPQGSIFGYILLMFFFLFVSLYQK